VLTCSGWRAHRWRFERVPGRILVGLSGRVDLRMTAWIIVCPSAPSDAWAHPLANACVDVAEPAGVSARLVGCVHVRHTGGYPYVGFTVGNARIARCWPGAHPLLSAVLRRLVARRSGGSTSGYVHGGSPSLTRVLVRCSHGSSSVIDPDIAGPAGGGSARPCGNFGVWLPPPRVGCWGCAAGRVRGAGAGRCWRWRAAVPLMRVRTAAGAHVGKRWPGEAEVP
jgi:hypothetical protein